MNRKQRIEQQILKSFSPEHLQIEDESSNHSVPKGAESHFKLVIVSNEFENQSRIQKHRSVNQALSQEFSQGLHALSLHLYTPKEWTKRQQQTTSSPACRGGSRHEQ